MSDWTPGVPVIGVIVTSPDPATVYHTISERLVLSAVTLVAFATAAFVTARTWPIRRLLGPAEALPAIGLLLAAALLALGVSLIVDWRRKRRAVESWKWETVADEQWRWEPIASGALSTGLEFDPIDPLDELERHLTDALAVLLREPHLKIHPSTVRMLNKFKERRPVVRDEKGRWRSVQ
jgi:hypothetical protein